MLDHSCARGCDEAVLGCDGPNSFDVYDETNCWAEFGICMDACLLAEMICENPPSPGTCLDDDHEEDDTLWQAHAMEPIHGREPVRLDGLVARAGDPDFFHAYADCCEHAGVELQWNPADGFLRAHLLDGRGRPLDLSGHRDVDAGAGAAHEVPAPRTRVREDADDRGGGMFDRLDQCGAPTLETIPRRRSHSRRPTRSARTAPIRPATPSCM